MKNAMEYVLSTSHGKDSMACIYVILEVLHWPLDRIVHAEAWATDDIPADPPEMVEWKHWAEEEIFRRWGYRVEHVRGKWTFERRFYDPLSKKAKKEFDGRTRGWPLGVKGSWCQRDLKIVAIGSGKDVVNYIGIAADEPERFGQLGEKKRSPLVAAGWTEEMCLNWCRENGLLSPIYDGCARGGCWFCPKQPLEQLRKLRKQYPKYWALMLKWDKDSPVTFKAGKIDKKTGILNPGKTVHEYEERFRLEDEGLLIPGDTKFKWDMLKDDMLNYRWF